MDASAAPGSAAQDPFLALIEAKDPAPLLHRLRDEDPVHFVAPFDFWFLTRHDDIKRLFNDPENCVQNPRAWVHYKPAPEGTLMRKIYEESLLFQNAEEHARFRRLFSSALTPRAVRRMDSQIRDVVERFASPLRGRRPGDVIDLLNDFTNPIPNTVISRIMGVSAGRDEVRFRELAQELIRGFFPFASPEAQAASEGALQEMAASVRAMVTERRNELGEDLISDLLRAQGSDARIHDDEIVMLIAILIGAGSETTNLGALFVIQTLLEHPEQLKRVRDDRALVPKAVNEVMRLNFVNGAGMTRFAVRDFVLRGKAIRKGQMLMLGLGGANRDPAVFKDPDVLDLERDNREVVVFGHGPHFCLGANLARQELGCMLDAALDILTPGSQVRSDLQRFERNGLFPRPLNLPVEITA